MSDERITDLILQRLENIERKLDSMQAQGCSKTNSFYAVRYPQFSNEWVRVTK